MKLKVLVVENDNMTITGKYRDAKEFTTICTS